MSEAKTPVPLAERVGRARQKSLAAGSRRIDVRLSREAAEALDRLAKQSGDSRTAVINRLILEALD
ncbi:ribbon-helix-helix protein, CopG family [Halomonas piscis]|uniref:ribbon-helix-helix protein, CopG family n=1 Tax=Halomonas piscis TaxID=3031727 RepID=UPI0028A2CD4F|nr:ribbon-helix-helix protein, CopG family [Halomonas piscis]